MNDAQDEISQAFAAIRVEVDQAARDAGRAPEEVALLAASKTVEPARLEQALSIGHRRFCENRVQEAKVKWPDLRDRFPDIELHLVGPLQSNKIRDAVALFDVIQSVDRPKVLRAIARIADETGRAPGIFVQVNIGSEPQKAGILPEAADELIAEAHEVFGLRMLGLMCIPPTEGNPAPHFDRLKDMATRNRLKALSMGMSADFPLAVAHGATIVRVGSALFGQRLVQA